MGIRSTRAEFEQVQKDNKQATISIPACNAPRDDDDPAYANRRSGELLCGLLYSSIVAIMMVWLLLNPNPKRVLKAQNPEFWVHPASLYPVLNAIPRSSSDQLTATWELSLLAINPNQNLDIYYDSLQASLFHGPGYQHIQNQSQKNELLVLAATSLRPLFLTTKNQITISFQLPMTSGYLGDDVVKEILDIGNDVISPRFGLKVSVWYRFNNTRVSDPEFVRYFCNRIQVRVFLPHNNSNSNGTRSLTKTTTAQAQATACELDRTMSSKYCD